MKKVLFLHGFTSSESCDMALALRESLPGEAKVIARTCLSIRRRR
nr:hypothetical protein [Bacteroides acidifaciens]